MRVLVTGAAGFIGSHVAEALLKRGDEVLVDAPIVVRVWNFVMPEELSVMGFDDMLAAPR